MGKIIQKGLYCTSDDDMEKFADKVDNFNRNQGKVLVELDGEWSTEATEHCGQAHWDISLEFESRGVQRAFWLEHSMNDPSF